MFVTSVLCGPLITFTPVLVSAAFHGDASEFSMAVGAFGVGGLLGAAGLLAVPPEQDRRRWSSRFAILYGFAVAVVALVPWFWGVPALMALAGAAMTVSNTSANSLLQATASPRLLGQTVSLFMLATRGGVPLGALLTGLSIEWLGVQACAAGQRRPGGRRSSRHRASVDALAPAQTDCDLAKPRGVTLRGAIWRKIARSRHREIRDRPRRGPSAASAPPIRLGARAPRVNCE